MGCWLDSTVCCIVVLVTVEVLGGETLLPVAVEGICGGLDGSKKEPD